MASRSDVRKFAVFILVLFSIVLILGAYFNSRRKRNDEQSILRVKNSDGSGIQVRSCTIHECFEISLCSLSVRDKIGVYVYDEMTFVDSHGNVLNVPYSFEYRQLLEAVKSSPYHQSNFSRACLFIPPVDTLSQLRINTSDVSRTIASIPGYVQFCALLVSRRPTLKKGVW